MMLFCDVVWIFFRIINFVILFSLFRYAFKHYFSQALKDQIKAQLDFWIKLRERVMAAHRTKKSIEETIIHDEEHIRLLLEHITQWRLYVERDFQRKQEEKAAYIHVMQKVREQQAQGYQQTLVRRVIIPEAFSQARVKLQQQYAHDKERAYAFIKRGIEQGIKHE